MNSKSGSEPIEIDIKDYDINGLDALKTSLNTTLSIIFNLCTSEFLFKIYKNMEKIMNKMCEYFFKQGNVNKHNQYN